MDLQIFGNWCNRRLLAGKVFVCVKGKRVVMGTAVRAHCGTAGASTPGVGTQPLSLQGFMAWESWRRYLWRNSEEEQH